MHLTKRGFMLSAGCAWLAGGARGAFAEDGTGPVAPVHLRATRAKTLLPGSAEPSPLVSFDGTATGPMLRLPKGAPLAIDLVNGLDIPFALQWHGMRGPNAIDGDWPLAGERLMPGATQAIRFTPPDSGLWWFHPAALPGGPDLTAQGLRGVLVVEETAPPAVDRDILLVLAHGPGPAAAPLTVNSQAAPEGTTAVPGARLRLRIVNASTTRAMILAVEGARPMIVAIDGQPSDLFEPVRDSVPVGPGARFEFMLDLPRDPGATLRLLLRGNKDGTDSVLFTCRTEGEAREALPPIAALPRDRALSPAIPLEQSARADLRIDPMAGDGPVRWRLNGAAGLDLPKKPLLSVKAGGSVTLGFDNRSDSLVALRLHGHVMRLLHAKDDGWEPYWRDSVLLPPRSVNHVAFIADNPGRWLLESALFDQAAFGLRHWFEVI